MKNGRVNIVVLDPSLGFKCYTGINIMRLETSEFTLSDNQEFVLREIGAKMNPQSGYARSLVKLLTGEDIGYMYQIWRKAFLMQS